MALDTQEDALKAGGVPGSPGWGHDPRARGRSRRWPAAWRCRTCRATTRQYYLAIRDAIRGTGPNPVTPAEALAVMSVIELGRRSDEVRRELPLDAVP